MTRDVMVRPPRPLRRAGNGSDPGEVGDHGRGEHDRHDQDQDGGVAQIAGDVVVLGAGALPNRMTSRRTPRREPKAVVARGTAAIEGRWLADRGSRRCRGRARALLVRRCWRAPGRRPCRSVGASFPRSEAEPPAGGPADGRYDTSRQLARTRTCPTSPSGCSTTCDRARVMLLAAHRSGRWVIVLSRRLSRATAAYRSLADETGGRSLGELLVSHGVRVRRERTAWPRSTDATGCSRPIPGSLQHIGLVRFNPFADTGSDQSFAIALLDDDRTGS